MQKTDDIWSFLELNFKLLGFKFDILIFFEKCLLAMHIIKELFTDSKLWVNVFLRFVAYV